VAVFIYCDAKKSVESVSLEVIMCSLKSTAN